MSNLIAENIKRYRSALHQSVTLVAVSKTKPVSDIKAAYEAGHRHFGENRIQEMAEKYEELPKDIHWHMIGNVQSNKIKYMAPFVHLVHGIDKAKRVKDLNKEARKAERVIDCLLQIHIAEEETKFGFDYEEAWNLLTDNPREKFPHVRIRGLMGMATNTDDEVKVRSEFRGLKGFFERICKQLGPEDFTILSTGMSGDYQIAIDEGSNMVRIGSSIFGKRDNQ